ncbi:PQQ-binding-like beta-propeller repeat protein [Microbacterium nanhaiense]|uniref:PQQ-binding-like beta-propeller repeat protein n=1 Tax=Microbacterium nanhaiense TaxID=1301026 RepID=UPI00166C0B30|nr:PQQ-binding-like beta-propeller repeat protein [Microbacterium nanhaiense]
MLKQKPVRMYAVAAIAAAVMLASGCDALTSPRPDATTPAPETPTTYAGEPAPDLALSPVELAGAPSYAEADRSEVVGLAGGRLLATRPGPENIIGVDAWDAGSGELAWDITTYKSYQLVLDHGFGRGLLEFAGGAVQRGEAQGYVVPIFGNLCGGGTRCMDDPYRVGIAMLNPADGAVMWTSDLTDHLGDDVSGISLHAVVADANADSVIVEVDAQLDEGGDTTVALVADAASGEVRWATRDAHLVSIAGDAILGEQDGALVAFDAATGAERWRGGSGTWIPREASAGYAAAMDPEADIVDVATGEVVAMGRFPVDPVVSDEFVAWVDATGETVSYDGNAALPGESGDGAGIAEAIDGEYIWIQGEGVLAVDRTGQARTETLPGSFVDARDGAVATVEEDGTVHLFRAG